MFCQLPWQQHATWGSKIGFHSTHPNPKQKKTKQTKPPSNQPISVLQKSTGTMCNFTQVSPRFTIIVAFNNNYQPKLVLTDAFLSSASILMATSCGSRPSTGMADESTKSLRLSPHSSSFRKETCKTGRKLTSTVAGRNTAKNTRPNPFENRACQTSRTLRRGKVNPRNPIRAVTQ